MGAHKHLCSLHKVNIDKLFWMGSSNNQLCWEVSYSTSKAELETEHVCLLVFSAWETILLSNIYNCSETGAERLQKTLGPLKTSRKITGRSMKLSNSLPPEMQNEQKGLLVSARQIFSKSYKAKRCYTRYFRIPNFLEECVKDFPEFHPNQRDDRHVYFVFSENCPVFLMLQTKTKP